MELIELKAIIPETLADELSDYFFEIESTEWGILQKEITDPYELFGLFEDAERARLAWMSYKSTIQPYRPVKHHRSASSRLGKCLQALCTGLERSTAALDSTVGTCQLPAASCCCLCLLDAGMAFGTGAHETTPAMRPPAARLCRSQR